MKKFIYVVLVLLTAFASLEASESINEQIQAILKASPQERVQLMNQLKLQLATMNEEKRVEAIKNLQGQGAGQGERNNGVGQYYRSMQQSQTMQQTHQQTMMRLQDGSGVNGQRQNGRQ